MKRNYYILTLLFIMKFGAIWSHTDNWIVRDFGNVKVKITTGYDYEEINKAFIFAQMVDVLSSNLGYDDLIFLDFEHYYIEECMPQYFLSFDRGTKKYTWGDKEDLDLFLQNNALVVRQRARQFAAKTTLQLAEIAMKSVDLIKSTQKEIEIHQWEINTIDTAFIKEQLLQPTSQQVKNILNLRFDRPEKDFKSGISYFFQNQEYTFFIRSVNEPEDSVATFKNFYDMKKVGTNVIVFDSDSSFYYIDERQRKVSKRQIIQETNDHFKPYNVQYIGGEKIAIYYWYTAIKEGVRSRHRTLIYLTDTEELIQDLDKLIDKR